MKYHLAGLKVSLLIHAAVFTLIFSVSRLNVAPGMSVPIEIGILYRRSRCIKKRFGGKDHAPIEKAGKKNGSSKAGGATAESTP